MLGRANLTGIMTFESLLKVVRLTIVISRSLIRVKYVSVVSHKKREMIVHPPLPCLVENIGLEPMTS